MGRIRLKGSIIRQIELQLIFESSCIFVDENGGQRAIEAGADCSNQFCFGDGYMVVEQHYSADCFQQTAVALTLELAQYVQAAIEDGY